MYIDCKEFLLLLTERDTLHPLYNIESWEGGMVDERMRGEDTLSIACIELELKLWMYA